MRVVFAGTSEFAVPSLQALVDSGHEMLAVITQPDRPSGRGGQIRMSPVKITALAYNLPVWQPEKISDPDFVARLKGLGQVDVMVVVAYGQKIPGEILSWPRFGVINVHGSLLPKYRGAAPVQHALIAGESKTGVTTMLLDEGWDTGDILLQREVEILPEEDAGELSSRLSKIGAELLLTTLSELENDTLKPIPQDHTAATYARALGRDAGSIDWSLPAVRVVNLVRGCTPKPGAFTARNRALVKIWRARVESESGEGTVPGEVVAIDRDGIVVAAGRGLVRLIEVQPESRRRMSAVEYATGARLKVGDRFDVRARVADSEKNA
ncbi:MAG: methionyl-tRNA formyltransferase [Armatimonadota bacterium]